jgi:hypothetical protein
MKTWSRKLASDAGTSMIEFALVLPLIAVVSLGVLEFGYALLDAHVVTRLSREGSNLISRDASLQDAVNAMKSMSTRPVNFDDGSSKIILSVIKNVGTLGAANYNKPVLYQRYEYGTLPGSSKLGTSGSPTFGPPPEYTAVNSDNNTSLQVTGMPVTVTLGGMVYVAEIYSRHQLITPLNAFGFTMPQILYSISYF